AGSPGCLLMIFRGLCAESGLVDRTKLERSFLVRTNLLREWVTGVQGALCDSCRPAFSGDSSESNVVRRVFV
ncbi:MULTISPECIES: hypothetical protein, partial [unclassified Frankia]|uniref:hypothetical protein n=1 Tax=unclassified Frankia TaxID=2632575 RepID=UPI002AD3D450